MESIIKKAEAAYLKESVNEDLRVGDTIKASSKVVEGEKSRLQSFEGVIISIQGKGIAKNIKIRKISHGVGAEKTIALHSPLLEDVQVVKKGKARRAKLYYLRNRIGKRALKVNVRTSLKEKAAAKSTVNPAPIPVPAAKIDEKQGQSETRPPSPSLEK